MHATPRDFGGRHRKAAPRHRPYFLVRDVVQAAEYYRDALGFSYPRFWGEPPNFCMPHRDGLIIMLAYATKGDSLVAEKPRVWAEKQLADISFSNFDVAPDGKRVVAIFDAEEAKPETHLRVLLNVGDELRRRDGAK